MLHYIIQIIVFQFVFLIVYNLFLRRETFFNYNRIYLLATTILSLVVPFIKIESFKNIGATNYFISLPEVILGASNTSEITNIALQTTSKVSSFTWSWNLVLYLGMCIAAIIFAYKIIKIIKLILENPKYKKDNLVIVKLANSNTAFSFFNYVFLGENLEEKDKGTILKHEKIHIQQKHTLDLLFFEVLRILFWFNPLIYIYQNQIASLHEFIADQKAAKNNNKQYYENLLAQIFNVKQISLVNPFFNQSLIKKRIVMLQKSNSKKTNVIKYVIVLPMLLAMLIYSSCSQQETTVQTLDPDMEQVVEKFRNQLQSENSKLSKEERLELAEYIIDEFKANIEHDEETESRLNTLSDTLRLLNKSKVNTTFNSTDFNGKDEVPFAVIDAIPMFPNCENETDKKACFNAEIAKHVSQNFNADLAKQLGLKGTQRISVQFKIDPNGHVIDAKARAEKPELEKEAVRVMNLLPKIIPGKHNGKAVTVLYGFPIKFKINE